MPEAQINPLSSSERVEVLDVLRGLAVGGILIGNMQWFSGYGMMPPALTEQWPVIDKAVHYLVHVFVEGKFYSVFSLLFGFGFALQIARAEERGDANASLFKRRLFWLLVIGLLHAYLLWAGDILSIYAVMGFVLLLFRKKADASLLKWVVILLAIPVITYTLFYILFLAFAPPDLAAGMQASQADRWYNGVRMVRESSYLEIVSGYNLQYIFGRYMGLIFDMRLPKILAMFLLGFYACRKGFFQSPVEHKPFIRKVLIYCLILGLIGNVLFSTLSGRETSFPPSAAGLISVVNYCFGVPAMALFYAAAVSMLWQKDMWRKVLGFLAPVGRMALTNYLMQTVICVLIFYGYGFGYFGNVGAVQATLIALAIFGFQIFASAMWLKYFSYGPMEWIWRQLTYGKRISLRNVSGAEGVAAD